MRSCSAAFVLLLMALAGCPAEPPAVDDDDITEPEPDPSPPGACALAIVPTKPGSADDFMVQVVEQPVDPDGDLVGVRISWTVDEVPRPELDGVLAVAADLTVRGQVWEVTGVPYDALGLEGPAATASVTVENGPPGPPTVIISPPEPVGGEDALVCMIQVPSEDPDEDEVTYTFEWQVDGDPYPEEFSAGPSTTIHDGDTVPRQDTAPAETWTCTVTPADDEESGEAGVAEVSTALPPPADDWSLEDVNPTSATFGQQVSPRDYLEKVSGWVFLHST